MKKRIPFKLLISAFLLLNLNAMGQLSGTYTINGSSPTSGTNYQTFAAAATDLNTLGVSSPVIFNVQAGTYTEQVSISTISGASAVNTVTFMGLGDLTTLEATPTTANRPVLSLDSASHIIIDSLRIEVLGTTGWGIHFMRHSDSNTVKRCRIVGQASANVYGIIGSGSISSISVVQNNGEFLSITNNIFEGCQRSIQFIGKTGPITTPSKKVNYGNNITVSNNTMLNFRGKAVVINHYHNVSVLGNTMTTSDASCNGAVSFWDAGDNVVFSKNKAYVASNANNTRMVVFAMAPGNGPAGDSLLPGIISNNFIQYAGTNSTNPTGIYVKNKSQIKIYHNTIKTKNQGSNANCIWLDASNARDLNGIELRNNIMYLENSGSGQFVYNATRGDVFKNMVVDHNDYYCENGYFNIDIPNGSTGTSTFTSFANYQANTIGYGTGALNVDPGFVSATDLHASAVGMNDSAAVISSISTDIDGDIRSATNPDIGADEYNPPTCSVPTGITAINILANSADVYWVQSNLGSTFKIEYGLSGFTPGAGTIISSNNDTISISGLSQQTTYDIYIKEMCSGGDSSAATSISFTTGCGLVSTYPYIENFQGSNWVSGSGTTNSGYAIDPCWNISSSAAFSWGTRSGSTSSSTTGPANGYGGSGKYVFAEASSGSAGSTSNLISPNFDLSPLTVPQLTFRYHMDGTDMGSLMVWAWNGNSYDTLFTLSGSQGNSWEEAIINLSNYQNDTMHLVFQATRGGGFRSDIAIDTVVVEEAPPCPKVGQVTFSGITSSSVNLDFNSSGNEFNVEFGPTGFSQGTGTTASLQNSGDTVYGLAPNTIYDFFIQNNCIDSSNGTSSWTGPFTARTLCSYTNSYFTDWDYLANGETDFCWTFSAYGTTSAYARAFDPAATVALQPFSGNNYYRVFNSGSTSNYLMSPEISDLATNTLQVRFQATDTYSGSTGLPQFYIGTMSSINDTASFFPLDTVSTISNNWTEFTVQLLSIPAGHKHVVIRHANNANNVFMGIDDLHIETIPLCTPPTAAVISNLVDTGFVLNWTAGDGTSFDIEYGTAGFTLGSGTSILGLTGTMDTITGLLPDTCYEFYIKGQCPSNNSPWYGPITVCTPCPILVAPFVEDFESSDWFVGLAATNEIDDCWTRVPAGTGVYRWQTGSGATGSSSTGPSGGVGGTGKYLYTEASSGSNSSLANLVMPEADFSGLTQPALNFSYHMYGNGINELYVLIDDGSQIDTIWSINGQQQTSSADPWKEAFVDITAYKSQTAIISFVGKRGSNLRGDISIDDVGIDELPSCLPPFNLNLDTFAVTTASISWSSLGSGNTYKIEFGPSGFSQGSNTAGVVYTNSSPTTLTGLIPNTSYDLYLTDLCDSTTWIGPISFTTIISDDAGLQSLISPSNLACGDSNYVVEVNVINNGLNTINSLPITANITGSMMLSVNTTYNSPIAPGASVIIPVGSINTYLGGLINVEVISGLAGDQDKSNDTLRLTSLDIISAEPNVLPFDSLCVNDTAGQFIAKTQMGVINNWYFNATDLVPFASKDTVNVAPNQTLFLDRSKEVDQLIFDINGFSNYGNMFKLYIKKDIVFTGFTFEPATNGTMEPIAFFKQGGWRGFETNKSAWTAIDSATITGGINNTWTQLLFTTPVSFSAGDTISIYIANKMTTKMETSGLPQVSAIGDLYLANDDFEYYAGATGGYFGTNIITQTIPRAVSSILHYTSNDVCGGGRLPFTMGVKSDSAAANFISTPNPNGSDISFDASSSKGHLYNWNFGDGNLGMGQMTSNTYSSSGTYTVTLMVTDTICGTTDSISKTVVATVGLSEFETGERVFVYPNPNNGKFNLELELNAGHEVELVLVNTLGKVVYSEKLGNIGGHSTTELNVDNLAKGMYYLNVLANEKSVTLKISIL